MTLVQFETELNQGRYSGDELLAIRLALYFRELHWERNALRQSKLSSEVTAQLYPKTSEFNHALSTAISKQIAEIDMEIKETQQVFEENGLSRLTIPVVTRMQSSEQFAKWGNGLIGIANAIDNLNASAGPSAVLDV